MAEAITYMADAPIVGKKFTCKRCKRVYAYPLAEARPIRCECGWWYYNDGVAIREAYWERIAPYRTPENVKAMFAPKD